MKHIFFYLSIFFLSLMFYSCAQEELAEPSDLDYGVVYANVELPAETKVNYSEVDGTGKASGLKSVWEDGDFFYAVNGSDKPVKFTLLSGAGTSTAVFSAEASGISASTMWTAVLGKKVNASSASVKCTYDGQTGKVSDLGNTDFIVSNGSGLNPKFNFSEGSRLSYFLRIKLPAGIRYIEYNLNADWEVTASANTAGYKGHFDDVCTIDLGAESTKGDCAYLSIPAALNNDKNNILKGTILTFFSADKRKSNGFVINEDLSDNGGSIGTADLREMTLYDRPLTDEAISFGAISIKIEKDVDGVSSYNNLDDYYLSTTVAPQWAPFNLCANISSPSGREDLYGGYFCWGEITPKKSFANDDDHYLYHGGNTIGGIDNYQSTWIGPKCTYGVSNGYKKGTMIFQRISGTKYDAARVKWGNEWRMPMPEELMTFTGGSLSTDDAGTTTATNFVSENIGFGAGTYYGKDVPGRKFTKGGKSIFFPHTGRYATSLAYNGVRGFYWSDSRIRATPSNQNLTNQPLTNETSGGSRNYGSQNTYNGLVIRPVRNIDVMSSNSCTSPSVIEEGSTMFHGSPIYPNTNLYGWIHDESDNGISGVIVSDGYTCTTTDANGVYQMSADSRIRTVNVTVPASYKIPMDTDGKPVFYQAVSLSETASQHDFALESRENPGDRFTILFLADEHINTSKVSTSISRFQTAMDDVQETVTDLSDGLPVGPANVSAGEIIGISLGDQMWDNITSSNTATVLKEFRGISNASKEKVPFFFVIGNHDLDESQSTDYDSENAFINNFGPTNYSFDIGNAHVIVMDDIIYTGSGTKEGFTNEQVAWLKADVAKVTDKGSKIAILCCHVPLSSASAGDAETQNAVMSQLKNYFYSVHVFSGHNHVANNNYYAGWKAKGGRNITEHTLQSLAGFWWLADISYVSGSPAGYGVYTFDQDDLYAEYNKLNKEDAGFQFRVYNANHTYNSYEDSGKSWWSWKMNEGSRGYKEFDWSGVGSGYVVRLWDATSSNDSDNTWTVKLNGSTTLTRVSDSGVQDAAAASYVFNTSGLGETYGDAKKETNQIWYGGSSFSSTFTITATHTMPSGWSATYTLSNKYVDKKSYNGFPYGVRY